MSLIVPPTPAPKPNRLLWVFAAILCLCTLVALWVTAARVKANKMAARYGERIEDAPVAAPRPRLRIPATPKPSIGDYFASAPKTETTDVEIDPAAPRDLQKEVLREAERAGVSVRFVVGEGGLTRLDLPRDEPLRIEHLQVRFGDGDTILVSDAKGRPLVEFPGARPGQVRRWQEFQLRVGEVRKEAVTVDVELKPGEPCYGSGVYRALKSGLRIGFPRNAAITIMEADFQAAKLKLRFDADAVSAERTIEPGATGTIFAIDFKLDRDAGGGLRLSLQRPD